MTTLKQTLTIGISKLSFLDKYCLVSFEALKNKIDSACYLLTGKLDKVDNHCVLQNANLSFADLLCNCNSSQLFFADLMCSVKLTELIKNDLECLIESIKLTKQDKACEIPTITLDWLDKSCLIQQVKLLVQDIMCSVKITKLNILDFNIYINTTMLNYLDFLCSANQTAKPSQIFDIIKTCILKHFASLGVYMIYNNVSLKRLDTQELIPIVSGNVSCDWNSWLYNFSCELAKDYTDLVDAEVELTVNGYKFNFVIEKIDRKYQFGDFSYTANGLSKACVLGEPYSSNYTKTFVDATTAQTLASQEISPINLDWQILDWTIPADMYSVSNQSKINIVSQVAKAVGACVQSHATDNKLIVKPKYRADWKLTTDFKHILPSLIISQSVLYKDDPICNYVIVSGTKKCLNYEFLVHCKRGDADSPASPVADVLLFTRNACVERGREIIEECSYEQENHNIETFLDLATSPLILPCDVVYVDDNKEQWRGIAKSTKISFSYGDVKQNLEIERKFF